MRARILQNCVLLVFFWRTIFKSIPLNANYQNDNLTFSELFYILIFSRNCLKYNHAILKYLNSIPVQNLGIPLKSFAI